MSGLRVENLQIRYGPVAAVRGISFSCERGQIVTIVGPNGAGKSSSLLAIAGGNEHGSIQGSVVFEGHELLGAPAESIVKRGIALVPERRRIFGTLSVEENLRLGATVRTREEADLTMDEVMDRFPVLAERRHSRARLLSGGQQQQLTIGRALMSRPSMLLLDEPSLGLAPLIVDSVFEVIGAMREEGIGIVLVEQNANRAIEIADRSIVMRNGEIVGDGDRLNREELTAAFLGTSQPESKP